MLKYDSLTNPGLSQGNHSLKVFWLTNFWVDNIQFPTHHKKSVKTNKSQSIKEIQPNIPRKRLLPWSQRDAAAQQRVKLENPSGEIQKSTGDYQWFDIFPGVN